jgi:hypothetical protein
MDLRILECLRQIHENHQEMLKLLDHLAQHPALKKELLELAHFRLRECHATVNAEILEYLRQTELTEAVLFSELRREQEKKMQTPEKDTVLQRLIAGGKGSPLQ